MSGTDKNVFVLKGELEEELEKSKSYFDTRDAITEKLLDYMIKNPSEDDSETNPSLEGDPKPDDKKGKKDKKKKKKTISPNMFLWVGDMDVNGKDFTIPVKLNSQQFNQSTDGKKREKQIKKLGNRIEEFFGLGRYYDPEEEEELDEWIIPVKTFKGFAQQNFET